MQRVIIYIEREGFQARNEAVAAAADWVSQGYRGAVTVENEWTASVDERWEG
jgi:hypothetical protein